MIQRIWAAPPGVLRFRAVGEVRASDYEEVVEPALEAVVSAGRPIRIVLEVGPEFDRYSLGAGRDDVALALTILRSCERCVVVTDRHAVRRAVSGFGELVASHVRAFGIAQLDEALVWAASEPA